MKTIITSALVISGVIGSAMADPVSCEERQRGLFDSLSDPQEVMQPKGTNTLGHSVTLDGFALGTTSTKEQPKPVRSNSFEKDKKAQPFMSNAKPEVVAKPGLFTRFITWVKGIFCF